MPSPLQNRHLVVVGASAGGIEALRELVRQLPKDFAAPIAVVLHTSPQSPGVLHEILSRSGPLTAINPNTTERLLPSRIYVAPPDFHLLVEPGLVRLTKGPRENRFRPAIDPLFRSAAQVYGPGAIGVILTGNLDDGTAGLWAIKQLGGTTIVQDPAEAMYPSMPESALRHVQVDRVLPLAHIGAALQAAVRTPLREEVAPPANLDVEVRIAKEEDPIRAGVTDMAEPSTFACPECHGVLLQLKEAGRVRFRCHTGHAFSAESLLAEISEGIESALWNAIRSLQEGALLLQELGTHVESHKPGAGTALVTRGDRLLRQADALRDIVMSPAEGGANAAEPAANR
jgi:two-component system, chemotaxis family, protein-glutamate methylesterase/glutaminase